MSDIIKITDSTAPESDAVKPDIIEITDFDAPELDIYARLTENQLLNRHEPEKGLFIAESPKVVERALDAGCQPVSLLLERKHIKGEAKHIIERCPDVPVYTSDFDVLKQLTGFAGRADNQSLPIAEQFRFRHSRIALIKFQMRVGNDMVKISQTRLILCKDQNMTGAAVHNMAAGTQRHHIFIDRLNIGNAALFQHFRKPQIEITAGQSIIGGAVMIKFRQAEGIGNQIQLVLGKLGHQILGQDQSVDIGRRKGELQPLTSSGQEAHIKIRVVGHQRTFSAEAQKVPQGRPFRQEARRGGR